MSESNKKGLQTLHELNPSFTTSSSVPTNNDNIMVEHWFSSSGAEDIHIPTTSGNPMVARGAFGEISIAIRTTVGCWRFVAVKTIQKATTASTITSAFSAPASSSSNSSKPKLTREVFHEICALRMLNPHPNIVELLAVYPASQKQDLMASASSVSLAFSYCPTDLYLTLEWRRRTLKPPVPFDVMKTVAHDIFSALDHCHSHGVLHCDIKPGNFLVASSGIVQLCDFGLAKPLEGTVEDESTRGMCTLYYRPPELLLGGFADDPSVDTFSAGLVIAELLNGLPLFQGGNVLGQLAALYDVLGTPSIADWPDVQDLPDYGKLNFATKTRRPLEVLLPRALESPFLMELLQQLIVLNPRKRLSAGKALHHEWFSTASWSGASVRKMLQQELIPTQLCEQILLSNPNMDLTVASKQAIDQASTRRSFLSSLQHWKTPDTMADDNSQSRILERCRQLCPAGIAS